VLRRQPGVVSVEPFGAALHLFLTPGLTSVEALEKEAGKEGIEPVVFRPMAPSLEDAFIALIKKSEDGSQNPERRNQ
jgi:hypothetical protein